MAPIFLDFGLPSSPTFLFFSLCSNVALNASTGFDGLREKATQQTRNTCNPCCCKVAAAGSILKAPAPFTFGTSSDPPPKSVTLGAIRQLADGRPKTDESISTATKKTEKSSGRVDQSSERCELMSNEIAKKNPRAPLLVVAGQPFVCK